jgi:glycosyltransferase involved in cell wall biosynthesis
MSQAQRLSKPGRLLILGPYPPPYGGIASQIGNTVPHLLEAGFERVQVVSWAREESLTVEGNFVRQRIDLRRRWPLLLSNPLRWMGAYRRLRRSGMPAGMAVGESLRLLVTQELICEHRFDIVHYFMLTEGLTAPLLKRRAPAVRLALTIYGEIFHQQQLFVGRPQLISEQLDAMDHCMSSSCYCARSVETLGILNHMIEPLYYGVDLQRFSPRNDGAAFRAKAAIAPQAKVLFFFARLMDEMGADVVADVIPEVLAKRSDTVFVVAGADGPVAARFRQLQSEHAGRVHLYVNVPGADVPAMYAACDLLLAPTRERHACMGMSIKEAMASGKVGICSRSGGIPEAVVDGKTGVLLPTGPDLHVDRADMVAAILELCADDARRVAMGAAARQRAEEMFDNQRTAARLIEIYRKLLDA